MSVGQADPRELPGGREAEFDVGPAQPGGLRHGEAGQGLAEALGDPLQPCLPVVRGQGSDDVHRELALAVEDGQVEAVELLLLGTHVQLLLLGHREDVGDEEGLLGDGQGVVFIEPGQSAL